MRWLPKTAVRFSRSRSQVVRELVAALLRNEGHLAVRDARRRDAAQERLPIRQVQVRQAQAQGGVAELDLGIIGIVALDQVHWAGQLGPQQRFAFPRGDQVEAADQHVLLRPGRAVHGDIVIGARVQCGGCLAGARDLEIQQVELAAGDNDRTGFGQLHLVGRTDGG